MDANMFLYYIFNFLPFALMFIAYVLLCKRIASLEKTVEAGVKIIQMLTEKIVPTEKK